ncbi:hypothetical protein F3Y22_tig00008706pilonHSYRG00031 [Hibiscus syriacus]|uniref:FRIGIDA-like protein n=1 Tax=Hibiscus syriacus TaxID=106335 RepID=A0A6A3CE93_HIBSY|nr:hypothetical protein F3Y22_tig00008706pilonHSYRG00031 [Hibiscus syriacus]
MSSFSISWSDLESHFTALQNSVTRRFRLLECRESSRNPVVAAPVSEHTRCSTHSSSSKQGDPSASQPLTTPGRVDPVTDSVLTRPELKEFCDRMDWKGLRKYISDHDKEREAIQMELLDKGELVEYLFVAVGCRKAIMLCSSVGLGEKVYDLFQKLVDNGKQHLAVRFIFEFGLAESFPPVLLLDSYLKGTKKLAEQVCIDGKNSYRSAFRSVLRRSRSSWQTGNALQNLLLLGLNSQQQQAIESVCQQAKKKKKKKVQGKQQQTGNKRPRTTATVSPTPAGLFPDQPAAYSSSLTGPYGLAGPTPAVNPYSSVSATAVFDLAGALLGFSTTPNPAASHPYPYGQQPFNGAYGLPPQYHLK